MSQQTDTHARPILIVEDERKIAELLRDYLVNAGYSSHWIADGRQAVDWALEHQPLLVLLDVMLPGKDGLTICSELRRSSNVPIVMVTARVEEVDRLLGLDVGADDYICKPFSPREVVARIAAILRRTEWQASEPRPAYRGIVVDQDRYEVSVEGKPVELTPVELRLLTVLLATPGRVVPRAELVKRMYDDNRVVSERTADSHVKNLRQKLASVNTGDELIHSIYGAGYKLE